MQLKCSKLHFGCSIGLYTCIEAFRKKNSLNGLTLKIVIMNREVTLELLNDRLFFDILLGLNIIWQDDHSNDYHFSVLNEEDWRNNLQKIRFINPENKFDYAKYGDFFIYNSKLYILTERFDYIKFDSKKKINDSFYKSIIDSYKFVIEANFAGFYIGREDDLGESIYYGDILKVELNNFSKCKNCEYFESHFKDRKNINVNKVYGPISLTRGWHHCSNPNEPYYIFDQHFGVIPNFCMAVKTEIVANVYYDFFKEKPPFNLNVIYKAVLPDVFVTCKFWDYFISKSNREGKSNNEIWESAIINFRKGNTKHRQYFIKMSNVFWEIKSSMMIFYNSIKIKRQKFLNNNLNDAQQ